MFCAFNTARLVIKSRDTPNHENKLLQCSKFSTHANIGICTVQGLLGVHYNNPWTTVECINYFISTLWPTHRYVKPPAHFTLQGP